MEGGAEEHGTCADMRGRTGSLESESTAQGRPLSCGTLSMGDAESLQALRSL